MLMNVNQPVIIPALSDESLRDFSLLVYAHNYERAVLKLVEILDALETGSVNLRAAISDREIVKIQTQIAAAVTALFCDPKFGLNMQGLSALMSLKCQLRTIFESSGYQNMRHMFPLIGITEKNGSVKFQHEQAKNKFILICTLDIAPKKITQIIQQLDRDRRFLFWLSLLDTRNVTTKRENRLRQEVVNMGDKIQGCAANSIGELQALVRVWMLCSYWGYDNKHYVKEVLNSVLRNTMKSQQVKEPNLPRKLHVEKPKMLIIVEAWKYKNAMYRCYANAIISLKERFHIILLGQDGTIDAEGTSFFDEVLEFKVEAPVRELVDQIAAMEPDIIYYPSIGMQQTILQFAQLRIAPIQVMTTGHPASSFSDQIDYLVLDEDLLCAPEKISETILVLENGALTFQKPVETNLKPRQFSKPDVVNISVNSLYFKLSYEFLKVCEEISQRSKVPLHFHFIIGLNGLNKIPFIEYISSRVSATCYEYLEYTEYMKVIRECDMQLAPFPFGNSNSFVDAISMGLPTICMDGPEIHTHNDAVWLRRAGLPESCITSSEEEYIAAAVQMIEDHDMRLGLTEKILASDLDHILFADAESEVKSDLLHLLGWAYDNHEEIQAKKKKVWHVADRADLIAAPGS